MGAAGTCRAGGGAAAAGRPLPDAGVADRMAGAAAGAAGTCPLAGRLAVGPRADLRAAGSVHPRRDPPAAARTVVDVGADLIPWWLWLAADMPDLNGPVGATLVFAAAAIAVDSIGSRLRAQHALAAQTERAEKEQARRAVLEERTRIARELHDVVSHHMSLIAVRAETASYRLPGLPEPAKAEFGSLSEEAREALVEMRRLLGVLRDDQPAALAPQPQLADLPVLVDTARKAGLSVELSVPVSLHQVPSGIGLCAYRIVQESLANASQHAPGAAVTVSVDHDVASVLLRVANGPGGHASPAGPVPNERGPGYGLTGMRERVALLGGSLSAGSAPDGGFVVSAVLPLGETP